MQWSERPLILLGHGVRLAGAAPLVPSLMEMGIPVVTSWSAKDLVDNDHPLYLGSTGIYGNRAANRAMYEADMILAIGNRLAIWNVGYEGPRPDQRLVIVEIDEDETLRFPQAEVVRQDARAFLEGILHERPQCDDWIAACAGWREAHPWLEEAHADRGGYISAYRFTAGLQPFLRPDEVIVTDMGTALCTAHQVLRLKPPMRLMTSGGLGEMGCALPAAIGASFATGKGDVLCLHCDGGMMLNLQELQTIVHHRLPIKIIVYRNDGYGMLKETQKKAGMAYSSVNDATGVSTPSFRRLAHSFGMLACDVRTWEDYRKAMPAFFAAREPSLIEFHMHPEEPLIPKLDPVYVDGKARSPEFWDMSPR